MLSKNVLENSNSKKKGHEKKNGTSFQHKIEIIDNMKMFIALHNFDFKIILKK